METNSQVAQKINKIDKPLITVISRKREKAQITNIRTKRNNITTDSSCIKQVRGKQYEQFYAIHSTTKMDKFLKTHKQLKTLGTHRSFKRIDNLALYL